MLATFGSGLLYLCASSVPKSDTASGLFVVQNAVGLKSPLYNSYPTRCVPIALAHPITQELIITNYSFTTRQVVKLRIDRPPDFEFHAGDYVYVNIPHVAKFEWHPFTISSAPEDEGLSSIYSPAKTSKIFQ